MATLTEIKREMKADTCTDIRRIMQMFARICEDDPEAVRAAFGPYLQRDTREKQERMVQFYKENAEYLADLFDYK